MSAKEKEVVLEEEITDAAENEAAESSEQQNGEMTQKMETFMSIGSGPIVTIKRLIEVGAHFGHNTKKWDPRMAEYIFTARHGIYIIDLAKTVDKVGKAYSELRRIVSEGGKVLFVGTKEPGDDIIREEALRCGSFYVTNRWLGGTLTNFKTIQKRIKHLATLKQMSDEGGLDHLTKKEAAKIRKTIMKLESNLGGIKEMRKIPNAIFVIDPNGEEIAVREARKVKIPVFGICDTNSNPALLDYVIPANDNSVKTIKLITQLMADSVVEGRGSSEIIAAYQKSEEVEATMEEAIKSVDVYEEKRLQLAAQNAQNKERFKRNWKFPKRNEEKVVEKINPDVDVETEMAMKDVQGDGND